jgi:hypothetical protein
VDALALDGEEGRGYLRKASGRGKHPLIRGYPNGATLPGKTRKRPAEYIGGCELTQGSEPSQYLEEEKTIVIPLVAASERGRAQTQSSTEISNLTFEISEEGWGL